MGFFGRYHDFGGFLGIIEGIFNVATRQPCLHLTFDILYAFHIPRSNLPALYKVEEIFKYASSSSLVKHSITRISG